MVIIRESETHPPFSESSSVRRLLCPLSSSPREEVELLLETCKLSLGESMLPLRKTSLEFDLFSLLAMMVDRRLRDSGLSSRSSTDLRRKRSFSLLTPLDVVGRRLSPSSLFSSLASLLPSVLVDSLLSSNLRRSRESVRRGDGDDIACTREQWHENAISSHNRNYPFIFNRWCLRLAAEWCVVSTP